MRRSSIIAFCIGFLTIGVTGSAGAATLEFTGTLQLQFSPPTLPGAVIPGAGDAQVTDDGSFHVLSFLLPGGGFGPFTTVMTASAYPVTGISSVRFTIIQNTAGSFTKISGGPPGGGPMGIQGLEKICFFTPGCIIPMKIPLTPTTGGGGFGIGGTQTVIGPMNVTVQNAPWTIGQPVMTIHTANSTVTTPVLPGGFAHGPASLTSSTAQTSGVLQLVTVSKVYTSLLYAIPEVPLTGILTLHFVPEPGTLLLVGLGVAALAAAGRCRSPR